MDLKFIVLISKRTTCFVQKYFEGQQNAFCGILCLCLLVIVVEISFQEIFRLLPCNCLQAHQSGKISDAN